MKRNEGKSDVWECSINGTVEDLMGGGDEVSGGAITGRDYDIEDVAEKEARAGMEQGPKGIDSNEEMSECDGGSEGVVENDLESTMDQEVNEARLVEGKVDYVQDAGEGKFLFPQGRMLTPHLQYPKDLKQPARNNGAEVLSVILF